MINLSDKVSAILEESITFIIIGTMCLQFLISIYSLIKAFNTLWENIIKYKAKSMIKTHDISSTLG